MTATQILAPILTLLLGTAPQGDVLYGSCKYSDGSKVAGKLTVSTSWKGKKTIARNGVYRLDFGEKVDRIITVYVEGKRYKLVLVRGETRLNIVLPKPATPRE